MYDTKCIFSAHILCMVHTPFNKRTASPTAKNSIPERTYWSAKFHKVGRYDQLRCKTFYNELWGNNITSNLGVTPGLSLLANLPPTMKLFLYERHQIFFCQSECFLQCTDKEYFFPIISSLPCI